MRRFAATILACVSLTVNASQAGLSFEPDLPHYFEHFDAGQKPWLPGQSLNIEEVFKNYQYFEIYFLKQGSEIKVRRYINNRKDHEERFRILPDGSLEKIFQ